MFCFLKFTNSFRVLNWGQPINLEFTRCRSRAWRPKHQTIEPQALSNLKFSKISHHMLLERFLCSHHNQSLNNSCHSLFVRMQINSNGSLPKHYPKPICPTSLKPTYTIIYMFLIMIAWVSIRNHQSILHFNISIMAPKGVIKWEYLFLSIRRICDPCWNALLKWKKITILIQSFDP